MPLLCCRRLLLALGSLLSPIAMAGFGQYPGDFVEADQWRADWQSSYFYRRIESELVTNRYGQFLLGDLKTESDLASSLVTLNYGVSAHTQFSIAGGYGYEKTAYDFHVQNGATLIADDKRKGPTDTYLAIGHRLALSTQSDLVLGLDARLPTARDDADHIGQGTVGGLGRVALTHQLPSGVFSLNASYETDDADDTPDSWSASVSHFARISDQTGFTITLRHQEIRPEHDDDDFVDVDDIEADTVSLSVSRALGSKLLLGLSGSYGVAHRYVAIRWPDFQEVKETTWSGGTLYLSYLF